MYEQTRPPPGSAIALTARYAWMTFVLGLFRPFLAINGHPVPVGWGRTVVPVPPGQYHLHVHVPYLLPPRIGTAETVVPVHPGQVVEVEYRAPAIGWLGGSIGPAPQQHRGRPAAIALMAVSLVVVLCAIGGLVVTALSVGGTATNEPVTLPTGGATTPRPSATGTKPTLRPATARTLVGPSYAAGEKTYTMGLSGFPFAFRTPPTWGCLPGRVSLPDARAWVCIDEGNPWDASAPEPDRGKRLQIALRPCPAPCGRAERATLDKEWFDAGEKPETAGSTSYVEHAADSKGRYTLDVSHFFPGTGTAKWQLGIFTYSQPESRVVVQKMVNDLLTQAG